MSQYSKKTWSAGEALTAAKLNTEFAAIAAAFNKLDSSNFSTSPSTAIPNGSLAMPAADFTITLTHPTDVNVSQDYTTQRDEGNGWTPTDFTLVGVSVLCGSSYAGAAAFKLYYDGSAASGALSLTGDHSGQIDTSPVVTAFSSDKLIEIRAETDGTGHAANVVMILHCAKAHTNNA